MTKKIEVDSTGRHPLGTAPIPVLSVVSSLYEIGVSSTAHDPTSQGPHPSNELFIN